MIGELEGEAAESDCGGVEVAFGVVDEEGFEVGCVEVEVFVFEEGEPGFWFSTVVVEVEGVVEDADSYSCVGLMGKVDVLVEDVFDFFVVVFEGFGDGAGPAGSGFVVGFEVGDEEAFEFDLVIYGFDCCCEGFGCVGLVFEVADGFVDDA